MKSEKEAVGQYVGNYTLLIKKTTKINNLCFEMWMHVYIHTYTYVRKYINF